MGSSINSKQPDDFKYGHGNYQTSCSSCRQTDLNELDRILRCLERAEPDNVGRLLEQCRVILTRLFNFAKTGEWVNAGSASRTVRHYVESSAGEKDLAYAQKVLKIYQQLEETYPSLVTDISAGDIAPEAEGTIRKAIDAIKQFVEDYELADQAKGVGKVLLSVLEQAAKAYLAHAMDAQVKQWQHGKEGPLNPYSSSPYKMIKN